MTNILLQLPEDQKQALKIVASQNDMSVNQLVRQLIRQFLIKNHFTLEFDFPK